MKKILTWWIIAFSFLAGASQSSYAASMSGDMTQQVLTTISSSSTPQESLVQWYYALENLVQRAQSLSWVASGQLQQLITTKNTLRTELDSKKSALVKTGINDFYIRYQSQLLNNDSIPTTCKDRYQLADDRSYAFNIPTALTLAKLDIESTCRRSWPANGDGIFQLHNRWYEDPGHFTTGDRVGMMYDFTKFLKNKVTTYNRRSQVASTDCSAKDMILTGQNAQVCMSYTHIDLDSIIKIGALYNGGSYPDSNRGRDIQPNAPKYVYGNFGSENASYNYDGLIVRMLKVLKYAR